MKKTLTTISLLLACLTASAQASFFEATMVRVCSLDEEGHVKECQDMESSTVFEVGAKLEYVRIIPPDGEREHYHAFKVDNSEDGKKYYFFTRRELLNNRYDFVLDFTDQTIYVNDHSDPTFGFLFYYSKTWRQ